MDSRQCARKLLRERPPTDSHHQMSPNLTLTENDTIYLFLQQRGCHGNNTTDLASSCFSNSDSEPEVPPVSTRHIKRRPHSTLRESQHWSKCSLIGCDSLTQNRPMDSFALSHEAPFCSSMCATNANADALTYGSPGMPRNSRSHHQRELSSSSYIEPTHCRLAMDFLEERAEIRYGSAPQYLQTSPSRRARNHETSINSDATAFMQAPLHRPGVTGYITKTRRDVLKRKLKKIRRHFHNIHHPRSDLQTLAVL